MRELARAALFCGLASAISLPQPDDSAIAGVVVEDHSGAPVRNAVVRLSERDRLGILKEVETSREGRFDFHALPPGPYRVEIEKPNYGSTIVALDSGRGADADVPVLRLVRYGTIAGRLTEPGQTQIVAVELVPPGAEPRRFSAAVTPTTAEFRLFNLPPARYVLAAVNASTGGVVRRGVALHPSNVPPREFVIAGGDEYDSVEMMIPSADSFSVRGRVHAADSKAVQPVLLSLRSADDASALVWSGLLRSNGEILIENVVPGRYELTATVGPVVKPRLSGKIRFDLDRPGIDNLELPIEPVTAPKIDHVSVRSAEPASIRGKVSGGSTPVFVTLIDRTPGRTSPIRAALVHSNGDFSFDELEAGRYHVAAHPATSRVVRWITASSKSADHIELAAGESRTIDVRLAGQGR